MSSELRNIDGITRPPDGPDATSDDFAATAPAARKTAGQARPIRPTRSAESLASWREMVEGHLKLVESFRDDGKLVALIKGRPIGEKEDFFDLAKRLAEEARFIRDEIRKTINR